MVPHYRCPPLCTRANTKRAVCGCTQGGGGGGCALFKRYFTRSSFAKSTNGGLRIPCINYKSEETSFPVLVLRACFLLPSLPGESGGIFGEYFDVETIISGSRRFHYRDKICTNKEDSWYLLTFVVIFGVTRFVKPVYRECKQVSAINSADYLCTKR